MAIELEAQQRVNFVRDGIGLTPRDCGRLITWIAEERGIERDEYACGGIVAELEQRFAAELGKPAALFLPTGTLANHLALRAHAPGGGRVFVQAESHVYRDSGDVAQAVSGLNLIPLGEGRHGFELAEFERALERNAEEKVCVPARALSIESPVRRHPGQCFDPEALARILASARAHGLALHRDGARLHLEAAWRGTSAAELAAPFDTVYCSLHKCFNAPSGAVLAGPSDLIESLRPARRAFGGAPAGAWPAAAIALHYVEGYSQRLENVVLRSHELVEGLRKIEGFAVVQPPGGSHVSELLLSGIDAGGLRTQLEQHLIDLQETSDGRIMLHMNESLLHRELGLVLAAFSEAARTA